MIRHLIFLIALTAFIGGLGWAENPDESKVLRVPQQIAEARITRAGHLELVTLADLRDACESFDGYNVYIKDRSVIIDSFITVQRNRMCAEVYRDGLRREYQVQGMNSSLSYRIFFRDGDGTLVDFGIANPTPDPM